MSTSPEASGSGPQSFPKNALPSENGEGALLFARYRVERELGRGGMGQVLRAFDTKLRITVAVKLIPDQLVPDTEAVNDLRQEVLRGMALMHPCIVRTNHFELDESGAAIVMEFIDGFTLAELKEQQAGRCFEPDQLLGWLKDLASVLDYAHREARLIHRDLKPRNLMVTREGRLKVADFGISAILTDSLSRNTGSGPTSGTPPYMSPQQITGKRPRPEDDLYSLGATLYDLLTGKPPFFRGPAQGIFHQVLAELPPTLEERREELGVAGKLPIPAHWEQVIAELLDKDPARRPRSAGEVYERLRTVPAGEPRVAVELPSPPVEAETLPAGGEAVPADDAVTLPGPAAPPIEVASPRPSSPPPPAQAKAQLPPMVMTLAPLAPWYQERWVILLAWIAILWVTNWLFYQAGLIQGYPIDQSLYWTFQRWFGSHGAAHVMGLLMPFLASFYIPFLLRLPWQRGVLWLGALAVGNWVQYWVYLWGMNHSWTYSSFDNDRAMFSRAVIVLGLQTVLAIGLCRRPWAIALAVLPHFFRQVPFLQDPLVRSAITCACIIYGAGWLFPPDRPAKRG